MNDRERLEKHFDRMAASFDAIYSGHKPLVGRTWDRLTRRNLHERLEFCITTLSPLSGRRVLDVGCGSGRGAIALAEHGAHVVGIDVSSRMLELAGRLAAANGVADRCRFEHGDVLGMDRDRVFDDVVATGFFDYIHEPEPVMRALGELVQERLVASFPARFAFRVPFRALWLRARDCPVRFFSAPDVRALCGRSGWDVIELRRRGPLLLLHARRRPR